MEESKQLKSKDKVVDQNIVQFPTNYITRGLVPLEELFDHNDIPFKPAKKGARSCYPRAQHRQPETSKTDKSIHRADY